MCSNGSDLICILNQEKPSLSAIQTGLEEYTLLEIRSLTTMINEQKNTLVTENKRDGKAWSFKV